MTPVGERPQGSVEAQVDWFSDTLGPFMAVLGAASIPVVFTDARDARHAIVFANGALGALTGHDPDMLVGQPIRILLGRAAENAVALSIKEAMVAGESGLWDLRCRRADNSAFWAGVYLSPVRDADQNLRCNFLSFVDLTRHLEHPQYKLRYTQEFYEKGPAIVAIVTGPDFRYTYANAAWRRMSFKGDPVGLKYLEVFPKPEEQITLRFLKKVYDSGKTFIGKGLWQNIFNTNSGEEELRHYDFIFHPMKDENGATTGIFCEGYSSAEKSTIRSRMNTMQSEMFTHSRINALGTMAEMLAHELNQPLAAIGNYTAGLKRLLDPASAGTAPLLQGLQGIDEASQRAAHVIRNLHDLTTRRQGAKLAFALDPAINDCIRLVSISSPAGIQIVNQINPELMVIGGKAQIEQVLINLLLNAVESVKNSHKRRIAISSDETISETIVIVNDTGRGVPAEEFDRIFVWGHSTKEESMGLGLPICRTIVESHGGRIWLERSTSDGSEFRFSVPRTPDLRQ